MSGGVEKVLLDKFVDKLKEVTEIFTDIFASLLFQTWHFFPFPLAFWLDIPFINLLGIVITAKVSYLYYNLLLRYIV